jgi:tape measure domain-containing protein
VPTYHLEILVDGKDNASGMLGKIAGGLGGLGSAALGLALPVGAAAAGIVGLGVSLNASAEQTQTAFSTLLGGGEAAKGFLDELRGFAASTPFEFPELADSAKKMLAFGFAAEDILPMMTNVGDAVSALGGGQAEMDRVTMALGQMSAKGKVSAEEMGQLAELGVPAWQMLADSMGLSVAEVMKLASEGKLAADTAIPALLAGMNETFGGGMQAQATTFNGLLSTLKDNASLALQAFTGPLFEQAKGRLETLGTLVSSPAFQQFAAMLGGMVGGAIGQLSGTIGPVVDGVTNLVGALVDAGPGSLEVGEAMGYLAAQLGLPAEAGEVFSAAIAIGGETLERLSGWVQAAAGWLQTSLLPAVTEAGQGFLTMLQPHIAWLAEFATTTLMPALEAVGQFLGDNLPGFISVVGPLITGLVDLGLSALELSLKAIATTWTTYLQPALSAMGKWLEDLTGGWDNLKRGADRLLGSLSDVADMIRGLASGEGLQIPEWLGNGLGALGVPGFAGGVTNYSGGLAMVGENGPELVGLPRGSNVYTAGDTRRMLAGNGGGGGGITINMGGVTVDSEERLRQFGAELEQRIRAAVGGDFDHHIDDFIRGQGALA